MTSRRLSVWVLSAEYAPYIDGGLGVAVTNLVDELIKQDAKITVITTTPEKTCSLTRSHNFTIARFPKQYSSNAIMRFLAAVQVSLPDLVHVHSLQYLKLQLSLKHLGIPSVYTCHSLVRKTARHYVYNPARQTLMLRNSDCVVVPSEAEQKRLHNIYSFCTAKTKVIHHGVTTRRKKEHQPRKGSLLYVGRIVPNKGLEQLIDALAILCISYPEVRLFLIGKGRKNYVQSLKRRIKHRGLNKRVHWLGYMDHEMVQDEYSNYSAVVMPSKSESFGLVALEALARGIPLVSTRAGGLSNFVSSQVAHVIPKVHAPVIATTISSMWESPLLTRERTVAGMQLSQKYQWSSAAFAYTQLYKILVSKSARL